MHAILGNNAVVQFDFVVSAGPEGRRTECLLTSGTYEDMEGVPVVRLLTLRTHALCRPGDKYNKALGKALALDRACRIAFAGSANRPHRKRIWTTFYRCLRTPDISILSGAPKYIPPQPQPKGGLGKLQDTLAKTNA
jgi:hypothetical protein